MNNVFRSIRAMLGLLVVGAAAATVVAGGGYDLAWHTVDSGGGTSDGGNFAVTGTIGQHDAGGPMAGGDYSVNGGFWAAGSAVTPTCPADLSGDGNVDVSDMLALLNNWGPCPGCASDLTGDDAVDVFDLLILLGAWGACP